MASHRAAFNAVHAHLGECLLEWGDRLTPVLAAWLAEQHIFLLGPPGTGKTYAIQLLAECTGTTNFDYLMSKFSTPEELFGPWSVKGLQQDRFQRVGAGMLQEAEFASLDEVWKANAAILNQLLRVVNEREFHNGTAGVQGVPLQTVACASNELPQDESLGALYDRLMVRLMVEPLRTPEGRRELLRRKATGWTPGQAPSLGPAHLEAIRSEVDAIETPDAILDALVAVWDEVQGAGAYVSPRRWGQSLRYLKACAWLTESAEVKDDHVLQLQHVLWEEPGQQADVLKAIEAHVNPAGIEAARLRDAVDEAFQGRPQDRDGLQAVVSRINAIRREVGNLDPDDDAVRALSQHVTSTRAQVMAELAEVL